MEKYNLSNLPYGYKDLEPYISEELLTLHHTKHHAAYVNNANALIDKGQTYTKQFSFNVGGYILHQMFWNNMKPKGGGELSGAFLKKITEDFGSFEKFKTDFTETAKSVEGSGWAALVWHKEHGSLNIIQIEKHNANLYPDQIILLVLDVWEHAYYLDYKNDRAKFIENWWNIVNWQEVEKRFNS
jgi:Fe-Mn family superoxide dismutase